MTTSQYMLGRKAYYRPQGMLWADNPGTLQNGIYVPDGYEVGTNETRLPSGTSTNNFIIISDDNRAPIEFSPNRIQKNDRMINGRMRSYYIADKLNISTSWDMLPSRSFYRDPSFKPEVVITNIVGDGTNIIYTAKNYFQVGQTISVVGANISGYNVEDAEVIAQTDQSFTIAGTATGTFIDSGAAYAYDSKTGKSPYASLSGNLMYTSDGGAGGVEMLDWYENNKGSFWVYLAYDKYTNFSGVDAKYGHLNQYNQIIEMYITDFKYSVQKRAGSNYDFWNISVTLEEV